MTTLRHIACSNQRHHPSRRPLPVRCASTRDPRRRPINPGTVPIPIRATSRKKATKADGRLATMDWPLQSPDLAPLGHTWGLDQRGDGQKDYRAKMYIVDDCRRCEAELQNELITAFRKEMPRKVVALIRAGGDVTRYWHWQALHTLGVVCVEDMSISHASIKMAIFTVLALCD